MERLPQRFGVTAHKVLGTGKSITALFSKVVISLRMMNFISRSEMTTIVATLIDLPVLSLVVIAGTDLR
jgi:hypothetical protein